MVISYSAACKGVDELKPAKMVMEEVANLAVVTSAF